MAVQQPCSSDGCERHARVSGLCQSHWMRSVSARPRDDQWKAKISAAHMGKSKSDAARAAMSRAKTGKVGFAHTDESKAKLRAAHLGKKFTDEHKAKLSGRNSVHWGKSPSHRPRAEYRGISMRSSWEVRAAKAFDKLGWEWQYEPRRFDLGDCTYTPDFFIKNTGVYWEVKGWFTPENQRKAALLREREPKAPLVICTRLILEAIERI